MPAIAREILKNLPWSAWGQAVVMLLLTQARPFGIVSPLAAAWMSAFAAGGQAWMLWAGLAGGAMLTGGASWWVMPALAAASIGVIRRVRVLGWMPLALAGLLALTEAVARTGADPAYAAQWLLCALTAVAAAVPLAAASGGQDHEWAQAAGRVRHRRIPVSVGLAENVDATYTGMYRFPGKARGQARECPPGSTSTAEFPGKSSSRSEAAIRQAGQALIGIGAAVGAAAGISGETGLLVAAMCAVGWKHGAGDILAILLAAALSVAGVPLATASAVAVLYAAAKLLQEHSGPVRGLGSLLAAGLWLLAGGDADALGYLIALLPAAALSALLPRRRSKEEVAQDAQWLQDRLRRQTQERLSAMADVLAEMAQGNGTGPDPPREDMLLLSLRTRLCEGCVRYERCWNGRAGEGLRLLCELITRSVNGTLPERVLPDMMRRCMRANIIPDRLYAELNRFSQMRSAHFARMDGAQRAQITIDIAADMLRTMAGTQAGSSDRERLETAERALHLGGLKDTAACWLDDGLALLRTGGWAGGECVRASQICSSVLGERFVPDWRDGRTCFLRKAAAVEVQTGWDSISAEGSRSGDSLYIGALDDRRQLVVISDGMGTGAAAAGESRKAVAAVRRFLQSGIDPERSALLTNRLLMDQGSGDMFATLDMCVIDKGRMEAVWIKMAACDSFLLRRGECRVISGGRLPLGIVAEAAPQVCTVRLQPGDVIVMGTDGAMEGLDAKAAQQCAFSRMDTDAERLAKRLRQAGEARRIHVDDQTLAVICVEKADRIGGAVRKTAGG